MKFTKARSRKPTRKFAAIQGIIAFITLGIAITVLFADWWPAPQINMWQAGILGDEYYPIITFLAIWVPICFPLLFLTKKLFGEYQDPEAASYTKEKSDDLEDL